MPLRAMLIKSALRDLLSVSYDMISILVISRCAAPPYPAAPDFLHGKACHTILRSLCSLTNRVPLPPHPGDRINRSMLSCRDMAPWLSIHSAPSKRGERWWRQTPKGKCISSSEARLACFPTPAGRLYGFIQTGAFYNLEAPPPPFEPYEPFEPGRRKAPKPLFLSGIPASAAMPLLPSLPLSGSLPRSGGMIS